MPRNDDAAWEFAKVAVAVESALSLLSEEEFESLRQRLREKAEQRAAEQRAKASQPAARRRAKAPGA